MPRIRCPFLVGHEAELELAFAARDAVRRGVDAGGRARRYLQGERVL